MAEMILNTEAEEITRTIVALAKEGDPIAMKLAFERIIPIKRDRTIRLNQLPDTGTCAGVDQALDNVVDAVANGFCTPAEGVQVAQILEVKRKAIETRELAERIEKIETSISERRSR